MNNPIYSGNVIKFPAARLPHTQLGLFASTANTTTVPSTGITGLAVRMTHRPCRACGSANFTIGSSAAIHSARLDCAECGRFAGWMSRGAYVFIQMTIEKFGRPVEPITVRNSHGEGF
jgi:hypothetical protein